MITELAKLLVRVLPTHQLLRFLFNEELPDFYFQETSDFTKIPKLKELKSSFLSALSKATNEEVIHGFEIFFGDRKYEHYKPTTLEIRVVAHKQFYEIKADIDLTLRGNKV